MERHARTLLEKFEAMETRTRFNDVVGGIGMILGLRARPCGHGAAKGRAA